MVAWTILRVKHLSLNFYKQCQLKKTTEISFKYHIFHLAKTKRRRGGGRNNYQDEKIVNDLQLVLAYHAVEGSPNSKQKQSFCTDSSSLIHIGVSYQKRQKQSLFNSNLNPFSVHFFVIPNIFCSSFCFLKIVPQKHNKEILHNLREH